jgi:small redox-active disulfide protein 2
MHVKILGSGCTKCEFLQENTEKALKNMAREYTIEKVKDRDAIIELGVMQTPALIINDTLVMAGQIASAEKIMKMIIKLGL